MNDLNQSALLMTPPKQIIEDDDGLLKADEIIKINIKSNLVILSACNSAIEDKSNSFKSLAMSFFYSGAKSLLVSNWPVETNSTLNLTLNFINFYNKGNVPHAVALRKSIKKLKSNQIVRIHIYGLHLVYKINNYFYFSS